MKKIVTTLAMGALAVICAFGFTACKDNDSGNTQSKTTVTEEEWKTALTYFRVDSENGVPIKSDYPRISFGCTVAQSYTYDGEEQTYGYSLSIDFDKKASSLEFAENDDSPAGGYYAWKDDTTYYGIGDGWRVDSETGKTIEFYSKGTMSEEEMLEGFDSNIFGYACGIYISTLELFDNYSKFTYSEEEEAYTATFENEETGAYEIAAKFKGGKLTRMEIKIVSEEYGTETYSYEYTYGATVTIPEFFINMELGETEKP